MLYRQIPRPSRRPHFEQAIWALADAMIHDRRVPAGRSDLAVPVASYLLQVHAGMPDHLRLAFRLLTLLFDAWTYPATARPFHMLDLAERQRSIQAWEGSRLEVRRGLMTFYRSFAIYGLYSELHGPKRPAPAGRPE